MEFEPYACDCGRGQRNRYAISRTTRYSKIMYSYSPHRRRALLFNRIHQVAPDNVFWATESAPQTASASSIGSAVFARFTVQQTTPFNTQKHGIVVCRV